MAVILLSVGGCLLQRYQSIARLDRYAVVAYSYRDEDKDKMVNAFKSNLMMSINFVKVKNNSLDTILISKDNNHIIQTCQNMNEIPQRVRSME